MLLSGCAGWTLHTPWTIYFVAWYINIRFSTDVVLGCLPLQSDAGDANEKGGREFILQIAAMTAIPSLWEREWQRNQQQCLGPKAVLGAITLSSICWKRELFSRDCLGSMFLAVVLAAWPPFVPTCLLSLVLQPSQRSCGLSNVLSVNYFTS